MLRSSSLQLGGCGREESGSLIKAQKNQAGRIRRQYNERGRNSPLDCLRLRGDRSSREGAQVNDSLSEESKQRLVYSFLLAAVLLLSIVLMGTWWELGRL